MVFGLGLEDRRCVVEVHRGEGGEVEIGPGVDRVSAKKGGMTRQRLLLVEGVLVTLATWEDADDSLVLPEPLAGQQALHGVRRLQDAFAQASHAAAAQPDDLALLERTAIALAAGLASGDEDICQAVAQHEECTPDAAPGVLATLGQLTPPGRLH